MTEREHLLDRIADIAERDRSHTDWNAPSWLTTHGLDTLFEFHPDQSIRRVASTTAHVARNVARLAGALDARSFSRLCTELTFYLGDELVERILEGAAAGKLSLDVALLGSNVADETAREFRIGSLHVLHGSDQHLAQTGDHGERLGAHNRAALPASSIFAHRTLPLLVGLLAGAAGLYFGHRRARA